MPMREPRGDSGRRILTIVQDSPDFYLRSCSAERLMPTARFSQQSSLWNAFHAYREEERELRSRLLFRDPIQAIIAYGTHHEGPFRILVARHIVHG